MGDGSPKGPSRRGAGAAAIRLFAQAAGLRRRFEVRRVLASGDRATVYAAWDAERGRDVAVKVLRLEKPDRRALARFREEVSAVGASGSARLVEVLDVEEAGEGLLVVMELADGESLRALLARGRLPVEEAVRVGREIAAALAALHGLGVAHRNLKPENVFVSGIGAVRLSDYGLARRWERNEERAQAGERPQIAGYLSPEQAVGEEPGAEGDLYSLGAVLHELLTGRVPLQRETPLLTAVAHVKEDVPDARRLVPELPAWLARVLARLLARDPAERYAGAEAVASDLAARRAPRRLPPRRRTIAAGAAGAALLLGAAALLPFWPWNSPPLGVLAADGEGGAVGVDTSGVVRWSRPDVAPGSRGALLRVGRGSRPDVAAILGTGTVEGERARTLTFLDGESGTARLTVTLPGPPELVGGRAEPFAAVRVERVEVDGDGHDRVAVTFARPSDGATYLVVHDPADGGSAAVWASRERYTLLGAAELDGEGGVKELLVQGPARGGYVGLAAVRLASRSSAPEAGSVPAAPPASHDPSAAAPAWFAILPAKGGAVLDAVRGTASFETPRGRVVLLGPDGFRRSLGGAGTAEERRAARREAWRELAALAEVERAGRLPEALARATRATRAAEVAADPPLLEWSLRNVARLTLRLGDRDEALGLWERLLARSEGPRAVGLEAATALHLAGELDAAIASYERALEEPPGARGTDEATELLVGAVLAHSERRAWSRAEGEIDRVAVTAPDLIGAAAWCRSWVRWRSGEAVDRPGPGTPRRGLFRYWSLELARAAGDPVSLESVDALAEAGAVPAPLLLALRARLLLDAGRREEALAAARRAWETAREIAGSDVEARGHLDLVAERLEEATAAQRAGSAPGRSHFP